MAIHHAIWVPAICVGYGLGLTLLLYGLEKVRAVQTLVVGNARFRALS